MRDTETRLAEAQALIKQHAENAELQKTLCQSSAAADVLSKTLLKCDNAFQEVVYTVEKARRSFIQPLFIFAESLQCND